MRRRRTDIFVDASIYTRVPRVSAPLEVYLTVLETTRTLVFIWWRARGSNPSEILIANETNTPSIPAPRTNGAKSGTRTHDLFLRREAL